MEKFQKKLKLYMKPVTGMNDLSNEKNKIIKGTLYIVSTPIGNLYDFSERGIKVLSEVDFIAAEDTRVTSKLLNRYNISKPFVIYHEHNKQKCGDIIAGRLQNGESCALVTDAGTPVISDPGEDIVRICINRGLNITAVPGPCAAINALILSGFKAESFVFEGFLIESGEARRNQIDKLSSETRTVILYESPHNIKKTLNDLYISFGERNIATCREMTKLNEEIIRCSIGEAINKFSGEDVRGEFVLVIEGKNKNAEEQFWYNLSVKEHVDFYINSGLGKMEAMKKTAHDRGVSKNIIYKELL